MALHSSPGMPGRVKAISGAGSLRMTGWKRLLPLPLNMFYNTGIATYIWVITNRKPAASTRQSAVDRRHPMVYALAQKSGQKEL